MDMNQVFGTALTMDLGVMTVTIQKTQVSYAQVSSKGEIKMGERGGGGVVREFMI